MSETIKVIGKKTMNADGDIETVNGGFSIDWCVITPQGKSDTYTDDIFGGNVNELQIVYSSNYPDVDDGSIVDIRGKQYISKYPSWDYSIGRSPWLSIHQPKKVLIVERLEA